MIFVLKTTIEMIINWTYCVNFPLEIWANAASSSARNAPKASFLVKVLEDILATFFQVSHRGRNVFDRSTNAFEKYC